MSVATGLPKRKVIWTAARNAVLPSIANLSLAIGLVVSGALLVELVFNYPGVGDLLLNAVQNEDYPLIQGTSNTWTCWFPIGDCPRSMGSLTVLRQSHRLGFVPIAKISIGRFPPTALHSAS